MQLQELVGRLFALLQKQEKPLESVYGYFTPPTEDITLESIYQWVYNHPQSGIFWFEKLGGKIE
jgi:hypothetical protein